MDRLLARTGQLPWWIAASVAWVWFGGEGEHRPLWRGVLNLAGWAMFAVSLRARAVTVADRPGGIRDHVRRSVATWRWPAAVAYGGITGWFAQWHYDVPWFAAVAGVVAFAVAAWAARPTPPDPDPDPWTRARGPAVT